MKTLTIIPQKRFNINKILKKILKKEFVKILKHEKFLSKQNKIYT